MFESKGLAGCHLEDQISEKRCGHLDNKELVSKEEMVKKIQESIKARKDKERKEKQKKKMLRPNTELLTEDVMQGQPRFVDISKGTLTAETKRSRAVNKATKYKKGIS